jgi:hypothetical protein
MGRGACFCAKPGGGSITTELSTAKSGVVDCWLSPGGGGTYATGANPREAVADVVNIPNSELLEAGGGGMFAIGATVNTPEP